MSLIRQPIVNLPFALSALYLCNENIFDLSKLRKPWCFRRSARFGSRLALTMLQVGQPHIVQLRLSKPTAIVSIAGNLATAFGVSSSSRKPAKQNPGQIPCFPACHEPHQPSSQAHILGIASSMAGLPAGSQVFAHGLNMDISNMRLCCPAV